MVKFISRLLCDHAQTVWIKSPAFQKSYLWCSFFLSSINCFFICLVIFWEVFLVNKLLKLLFHTHQGGKEKNKKQKFIKPSFYLPWMSEAVADPDLQIRRRGLVPPIFLV